MTGSILNHRAVVVCAALTAGLFAVSTSAWAGSAPAKPQSDFAQAVKGRPAYFLKHHIRIVLNEDWSQELHDASVIKIQKKEAGVLGEQNIPYEKGREKIQGLKAFTTTPDGQRHPTGKVQDLSMNQDDPVYSHMRRKVVTFKQVVPGAVLEISYSRIAQRDQLPNAYWLALSLTESTPVQDLLFEISIPKKLGIQRRFFGLKRDPVVTETKDRIIYSWRAEYYVPEESEDFTPPPTTQTAKEQIEFTSFNDWAAFDKVYYEASQKAILITPQIRAAGESAALGQSSVRGKTRAVLEYLQDNFRYVSMAFGENALIPHSTEEVFANKYGDCKDMTLLAKALLEAAGVKSELALFIDQDSTWDPQESLAVPSIFDHVLLWVRDPESGDFYADPLLDGYDIGEYPASMQAGWTFVINGSGGEFGHLPVFDEGRMLEKIEHTFDIERDGTAVITTQNQWDLDTSIERRAMFRSMSAQETKKFHEEMQKITGATGATLERKFEGIDDRYGPVRHITRIRVDRKFAPSGGIMVIDVAGFDRNTDFTSDERKSGIFIPTNTVTQRKYVYRFPEGSEILHIPEGLDIDSGYFAFSRTCLQDGSSVRLEETTRFRRAEIPASEYPAFKQLMDTLPARTDQKILVKVPDLPKAER